ncbi:MAG: molybdopterin molybdotransferase MoeA [Candidatus Thermoplasmatota archaeon]|nr:molybdopterin molybdotransferase MoeA [Candidatus Thermoplasmatota archaeon]
MNRFVNLIGYREAVSRISEYKWNPIGDVTAKVSRGLGMIAAEDIFAKMPLPTRERSLIDGYAIRSFDSTGASTENPVHFKIIGRKEAGSGKNFNVSRGDCVEIYTGASIPDGCDSVIMAENAVGSGDGITITEELSAGMNVSKVGEDIPKDFQIIHKGDQIDSFHITAMLSSGTTNIRIKKRINVGVFSTGNELFASSSDNIKNTAETAVKTFFESAFLKITRLGKCHDSAEEIAKKVIHSIDSMDGMIITGGTSLGRYDLVPEALSGIADTIFGGVRIRPGRTAALYSFSGKPVFSVSGFPSSAIISLWLFLPHYIRAVTGMNDGSRRMNMQVATGLHSKAGYTTVIPVRISEKNSMKVSPVSSGRSVRMVDLLKADGLVVVPDNVEGYSRNEVVEVHEVR